MKELKWITICSYIDEDTGEVITKAKAKQEYRIVKKIKIKTKTNYDGKQEYGARNYVGTTEITNICTKSGKQLSIW